MALTGKQKRFVEEYLKDFNGAAAYVRAGYKAKNGDVAKANASRLIANDNVSEAIRKGQAKTQEKFNLTQEWVVNGLKEEAEYKGENSSHSARVRARELLGKHIGLFADRLKIGGDSASPPVQIDWGSFAAAASRTDTTEETILEVQQRHQLNGTAPHD